ncbi:MAG: sensor histidine kinase [Planctomycetaceae bacterium]|nr:sensor histidine kinase [Planctomycetaceae bacterium]
MVQRSAVKLAHDVERLQAEVANLVAERNLLHQSLHLQERDRQLVAFEIHDGIIQEMTAALMFLESAGLSASFASPEAKELHERGVRVLQEALHEARRLIRGLIPIELDEHGLAASLERLVAKFRSDQGLEIDYRAEVSLDRLVPAAELIVLRIVQESLNNVWKHSQNNRAAVRLVQDNDELEVTVSDEGVGFSLADAPKSRYGLAGIRERARLLGGTATITSEPGRGTRVVVRFSYRELRVPPALVHRGPQPVPEQLSECNRQ